MESNVRSMARETASFSDCRFHGLISMGVPVGISFQSSSISSFVTAIQPSVQSCKACAFPTHAYSLGSPCSMMSPPGRPVSWRSQDRGDLDTRCEKLCKSGCWGFANRVCKCPRESDDLHAESSVLSACHQARLCTSVFPVLVIEAPVFARSCRRRPDLLGHWVVVQTADKKIEVSPRRDVAFVSNCICHCQFIACDVRLFRQGSVRDVRHRGRLLCHRGGWLRVRRLGCHWPGICSGRRRAQIRAGSRRIAGHERGLSLIASTTRSMLYPFTMPAFTTS